MIDTARRSPATQERKRHLLIVNHFAAPLSVAGGTRHVELARYLPAHGWRVTIAASDFHYQRRAYLRRAVWTDRQTLREECGATQFRWLWASPYEQNDWRRVRNWLSFAKSVLRLSASLDRPTMVIGSSPQLFAAWAAARVARQWRIPFVLEVRDLWPESLVAAGGRAGVSYCVLKGLAKHLYRRADRIVVLTRGVERYLQHEGIPREKLFYIPNGVDLAEFPAPCRGEKGLFRLIYVGAHGQANGLDAVVGAAQELREDGIHFLLVGDGPVKAYLERRVRAEKITNVEFQDPVPKTEIPKTLGQASAGLMVLRGARLFQFGVSPNKLFDYCAAGLPVVTNVRGEVGDMVLGAGAGVLARDASAGALAEAIRKLAGMSHARRLEMSRAGRAWVAREHNRPVLAKKLADMLNGLGSESSTL